MAVNAQRAPLIRAIVVAEQVHGERRSLDRSEFEYRLRLVPADEAGDAGTEYFVMSKDLSLRGLGFRHEAPLPYRRVRLSAADDRLEALQLDGLELEVVLRWCRFVGPGRYESGGTIARTAWPSIDPVASVA